MSATAPAATTHENRLAGETSPYLLQHKHNPVDWWPWGPDALAEAKRTAKPILLSVGYAACHWCHVMAHESFEDPATARVMNELFVNIKVDREERPDVDQIYMHALHMLGEQGGWPLTMFLTPDGEPVWGGTYFPPTPRYGRPGFTDVLRELARLFREEPGKIEQNRAALMARLAERARPQGKVTIGVAELDQVARRAAEAIDPVHGGMRGAPKFPNTTLFELIWRAGLRAATATPEAAAPGVAPGGTGGTGEPTNRYFTLVGTTLDRICEGGIYDHLGGGFARYSVDERWLVPHFEKMLYDNAQLLELLALAYTQTGKPLYRARAAETVEWLRREMTQPAGGFSASLDADSEGHEGKFYVWSRAQIEHVLGAADAALFAALYDVSDGGNFEGQNILNRLNNLPRSEEDEARLVMLRSMLHQERSKRVRPALDDKVLADWNGLMIAALANAATAFDEPSWTALAARGFRFVADHMTRGDRLGHSWRDGHLLYPGLASDFASMIKAGLALHEATGDSSFLDRAVAWQRALDRHYGNPEIGGYFLTADDAAGLVVRPSSTVDDATPNPNAVAAQNLIRMAILTGDGSWRTAVDRLFERLLPVAAESLFGHMALLNALDLRLRAAEVVITGTSPRAAALTTAALRLPFTERILVRAPTPEALPSGHPARDKVAAAPDGVAFICLGEHCSLPVSEPDDVAPAIRAMRD
jgi:uncharacterized protein YyaL (SSP411 family)